MVCKNFAFRLQWIIYSVLSVPLLSYPNMVILRGKKTFWRPGWGWRAKEAAGPLYLLTFRIIILQRETQALSWAVHSVLLEGVWLERNGKSQEMVCCMWPYTRGTYSTVCRPHCTPHDSSPWRNSISVSKICIINWITRYSCRGSLVSLPASRVLAAGYLVMF